MCIWWEHTHTQYTAHTKPKGSFKAPCDTAYLGENHGALLHCPPGVGGSWGPQLQALVWLWSLGELNPFFSILYHHWTYPTHPPSPCKVSFLLVKSKEGCLYRSWTQDPNGTCEQSVPNEQGSVPGWPTRTCWPLCLIRFFSSIIRSFLSTCTPSGPIIIQFLKRIE